MKTKLTYVLLGMFFILFGWCGIGTMKGYAQEGSTQPNANLPPRPTPGPTPTPNSEEPDLSNLDVKITISAYPTEVKMGDRVVFTVHVYNSGDQKIGGIYVLGLIPEVFEFQDVKTTLGTAGFNPDTNRAKVFIKPLLPNSEATIMFTVKVSNRATIGDKYYSAAQVFTGKADSPKIFSNWIKTQVANE